MAVTPSMTLDTREFERAMLDYTANTSRTLVTAVNGKMRDLCLSAVPRTALADSEDIKRVIENPKYIAWYCNKVFGVGNWGSEEWDLVVKGLRKRGASAYYMRSAWAKAGKKFPKNDASKLRNKKTGRNKQTGAKVSLALIRKSVSEVEAWWIAQDASDKKEKEKIGLEGLQESINFITKDMQEYLSRKSERLARKYSAP